MKEKTLEEIKNNVVKKRLYEGWADFNFYSREDAEERAEIVNEIAAEYANHVKAIALQEGFEKGRKAQKSIDEQNRDTLITHVWNAARKLEIGSGCIDMGTCRKLGVPLKYTWDHNFIDELKLTRPELLNAPDAVNPYTK